MKHIGFMLGMDEHGKGGTKVAVCNHGLCGPECEFVKPGETTDCLECVMVNIQHAEDVRVRAMERESERRGG